MEIRWLLFGLICVVLFSKTPAVEGHNLTGKSPNADSTDVLILNRAIIIGNKKTLDRIILRELTLKPGDSVLRFELEKMLLRDQNKIYNLRIFNTVKLRSLELPNKSFDLLIEVEERWFSFPVPIFELSDRNFNEWWQNYNHQFNRVNYGIRWYQYNFRGRNETIRLTAQLGYAPKFDLKYRIPYIDKKQKQGLIFEIDYTNAKNLAYRTFNHKLDFLSTRYSLRKRLTLGITYTYRKSFYETHALQIEYNKRSIADTIVNLNNQYFSQEKTHQWYPALSYHFTSEHRDVIAYPLKGYQITVGINQLGLGLSQDVNLTAANASLAYHKPLGKNLYFSNLSYGYVSTPTNQPYSLYYGQGYNSKFVRGYEIYVIEGPWHLLNKTTFKKKIFHHTYKLGILPWEQFQHLPVALFLKAYADVGYVKNYSYYEMQGRNKSFSNRAIAGMGLGLDLVTSYDGVFRIEYSYNRDGAHGFFFHIRKEF